MSFTIARLTLQLVYLILGVALISSCGGGGGGGGGPATATLTSNSVGDPSVGGAPVCEDCVSQDEAWDLERRYYRRNPRELLARSDGSRSLGNPQLPFNAERDPGSRIIFVDAQAGDNRDAEVYWWDGEQIIDSDGSSTDEAGRAYGSNPLRPNYAAIKPFRVLSADSRLRTQQGEPSPEYVDRSADRLWRFGGLAGGYPDWFLFRRGQVHTDFVQLAGGASKESPAVFAAYGEYSDGRAVLGSNIGSHNWGQPIASLHIAIFSIEAPAFGYFGLHEDVTDPSGNPVSAYLEDVKLRSIAYPPRESTFVRCIVSGNFDPAAHNQGYFTSSFFNEVTFDESIFYRNGYKDDPSRSLDPGRTIFDRNIYQGGGAQLGHRYVNVISADGGSGGPQMRLGGVIENSLIIEGYWYSSTRSNQPENAWLMESGQTGASAIVRDNVQLIYAYPSPADPDTLGSSDPRAQPGWGYSLQGASFGSLVSGNIISGAMLEDELGGEARFGLNMSFEEDSYGDGRVFSQRDNEILQNIVYKVAVGLNWEGVISSARNIEISENVFFADTAVEGAPSSEVRVSRNRFYVTGQGSLDDEAQLFTADLALAQQTEGWVDPDRTLRRYVLEELQLDLLDWRDVEDAYGEAAIDREANGEQYDPTGVKTFMAVAENMRAGGTESPPEFGKPDPGGDYNWDQRFTASAVVDWIREGFGLPAVNDPG